MKSKKGFTIHRMRCAGKAAVDTSSEFDSTGFNQNCIPSNDESASGIEMNAEECDDSVLEDRKMVFGNTSAGADSDVNMEEEEEFISKRSLRSQAKK